MIEMLVHTKLFLTTHKAMEQLEVSRVGPGPGHSQEGWAALLCSSRDGSERSPGTLVTLHHKTPEAWTQNIQREHCMDLQGLKPLLTAFPHVAFLHSIHFLLGAYTPGFSLSRKHLSHSWLSLT